MKKGLLITIGVIVVVVFILYRLFAGSYNNMVTKEEQVTGAWSQVENVYQRRADLIPNLVNTVKGYADFEQETLQGVIEARSKATGVNVNTDDLSPEKIQQFQQAQQGLSSALSRLMVVVERYPDLKANQNFIKLQDQLEGTENRIAVERRRFNEVTQDYNTYIRKFPQAMLAGMYGFDKKGYFEADQGAEQAPEVSFD
ncbi:LemA family protein [uncultured Marivirga sp.]|uniref:LemA family protein n=1 Tax=uncultured Marivirga sp. TaxID=1123707 RepID=UPI0030ED2091|tara:strand:+ start:314606 stop:315202 length:597 start_codon:yes stop_codon:yes gene_type:complete